MGKIDRSNYEVYFIDYIDGNLAADRIDDFLEFLKQNPDLKDELQLAAQDPLRLPDETISYRGKDSLLKNELTGSSAFDYRAIAWMEGDLTGEEKAGFEKELQDDLQKQNAFNLIKCLRLRPQPAISFPGKSSLLKNRSRGFLIWPARIAAILALGLLTWAIIPGVRQQPVSKHTPAISENKEPGHALQEPVPAPEKIQRPKKTTPSLLPVKSKASAPVNTPQQAVRTDVTSHPHETEIMAALEPIEATPVVSDPAMAIKLKAAAGEPHEKPEYTRLTDYLAQKLLAVPEGGELSLAGLASAGLQMAEQVSGNRLNVEKSDEGKIAEISLNTRLIGFSIPIKKNR